MFITLATVWGGLYAVYVHSENYKEEQKRIEREQAQWSNANNVDIGKELFISRNCANAVPVKFFMKFF